jgi:hypothetical protein
MQDSQLRLLMFLQDLLMLKKEMEDFQVVEKYEEMGFDRQQVRQTPGAD